MPSEVFTLLIPNQKEIQGQESSRAPNILIPYLLQQRYTNTQYYTHTPCITKSTELSTQFSSVTQSCSTLCHRMDCSTQASLSITNPEFTQTHAHRVGDSIQPSLPLSCPSPPAPNPSQHQGLFQWVSSLPQVAKVLDCQLQNQSFQWIFKVDFL